MVKVAPLALGAKARLRVGRRSILWALAFVVPLSSCTSNQVRPSGGMAPRTVPPNDLICESDGDCEILDWNVYGGCCWEGDEEPYAISRAAVKRQRGRRTAECDDVQCPLMDFVRVGRPTSCEDWNAVCSGRVCKRMPVE